MNLCAFYPGSIGWNLPYKYEIKLGDTPMTWRSTKLLNDYPLRRDRFVRFISEAKDLGLINFYGDITEPSKPNLEKLYYSSDIKIIPPFLFCWGRPAEFFG